MGEKAKDPLESEKDSPLKLINPVGFFHGWILASQQKEEEMFYNIKGSLPNEMFNQKKKKKENLKHETKIWGIKEKKMENDRIKGKRYRKKNLVISNIMDGWIVKRPQSFFLFWLLLNSNIHTHTHTFGWIDKDLIEKK